MPVISFTKLEIQALFGAAGNMNDDFEDYFSFHTDIKKFKAAFDSGMDKLLTHLPETKELTQLEEAEHDYKMESDESKYR